MVEGIDVSKWQGTVNWLAVKSAGKEFAVARSSIGRSTTDDTFASNYIRMSNRGLVPGAYHLVTGDSTGEEQALNWKRQLDAAGFGKGLLVLDVEGWTSTLNGLEAGTLKATEYLCQWVRDTYNRTPIIYTGVYWRENLKQHPDNFGSKLWLSYYGLNPVSNYVPKAWDSWTIWQYTDKGVVPGVNGDCDLNMSAVPLEHLKELAGWEWDELATPEEVANQVRGVVAAEVEKAVAQLRTSMGTQSDLVIDEVRNSEVAVREALATSNQALLSKDKEILLKLTDVVTLLAGDAAADTTSNAEVVSLINQLHSHVCKRVDLH